MRERRAILAGALTLLAGCLATAIGQEQKNVSAASTASSASVEKGRQSSALIADGNPATPKTPSEKSAARDAATASSIRDARTLRLEGEKRFHENCGRCHMAPPKFPPRAMATILRHMRVRALITDEDRRLILRYMTE